MTIEVKLDPHIGIQNTPLGPMEVDLGQYLVMAQTEHTEGWVHVGYICRPCPTNPRPPFNGLENFRKLPQTAKDEIVQKVAEAIGLASVRATEIIEPVVIEEAVDEEDDLDADA